MVSVYAYGCHGCTKNICTHICKRARAWGQVDTFSTGHIRPLLKVPNCIAPAHSLSTVLGHVASSERVVCRMNVCGVSCRVSVLVLVFVEHACRVSVEYIGVCIPGQLCVYAVCMSSKCVGVCSDLQLHTVHIHLPIHYTPYMYTHKYTRIPS